MCLALPIVPITESSQSPLTSSQGYCVLSIHQPSRHGWYSDVHPAADAGIERTMPRMKQVSGAGGYTTTTSLSSLHGELSEEGDANVRGGEERLMALSGGAVIVRGWWANHTSVADGCVCVAATYRPGPAVKGDGEREGERQHRRHCVSLQLLSSDTRLIVHLNTTALSAARQPARSPRRPAPLPALIISQTGLHEPARSSDSRRRSDKV